MFFCAFSFYYNLDFVRTMWGNNLYACIFPLYMYISLYLDYRSGCHVVDYTFCILADVNGAKFYILSKVYVYAFMHIFSFFLPDVYWLSAMCLPKSGHSAAHCLYSVIIVHYQDVKGSRLSQPLSFLKTWSLRNPVTKLSHNEVLKDNDIFKSKYLGHITSSRKIIKINM